MILTVTLNPSLDEWVELPTLAVGRLNRAGGFARYPGGKGINVSRVVHELGGRTQALGVAGGDDGLILRHLLNHLAIPHTLIQISGATRNNYKIRTEHPSRLTEINAPGPAVPSSALRQLERLMHRLAPRTRCAVFSGSLPPGVRTTIYRQWIQDARRRRLLTVLDASGEALRQGLSASPWLIKPNREEAEALSGRPLSTMAAVGRTAMALSRRGPELVVISLGKSGAVLASHRRGEVWMAAPPRVTTDSAVGAGDSFVAGFVVGWLRSRSLREAMRWGSASGAATAMTPGTELCHRRDVVRLLSRVRVTRLKAVR